MIRKTIYLLSSDLSVKKYSWAEVEAHILQNPSENIWIEAWEVFKPDLEN